MVYAYFGPEGLYAYDAKGDLAWKAVDALRHAGPRHRHLAGSVREPRDHPARRRQRRPLGARGLRQEDRQGSLEHEAHGRDQLEHAGARAERAAGPSSSPTATTSSSPTIRRPEGALADDRREEQRHPHAARRPRARDPDGRLSGQESHRHPPWRRAGRPARRVGIHAGHRLRPLEHPLRRLSLSLHRQRHRHMPRSEDRDGQVRRRTRSRAGALHGLAGRVRRICRDDERRRRHLHAQGRPHPRDRAHELDRRAGLLVAGDRQRPRSTSAPTSTCSRSGSERSRSWT